jgi:hypothetical protein
MNTKTSIAVSTVAIAAVVLIFASGPIVAAHQASAVVYVHRHYGYHGHYYRPYHGHGVYHKGVTVKTPRGIYHKGVTVRKY